MEGVQRYHEQKMFGETEVVDDAKNSVVSTVLINGADNCFEGAGNCLCRGHSAFFAKDTDIGTEVTATLSEIAIAQCAVAKCSPVA